MVKKVILFLFRPKKKQKFSIGATSEGVKKIAIMDRLLANEMDFRCLLQVILIL